MRINNLHILVIGLLFMIIGYVLKTTAILPNHLITIFGLVLVAGALASLVFKRLKK